MKDLIALTIGNTTIKAPSGIPTGGLTKAYGIGSNLITLIFVLAAILALIFLIWGGVKWVMSSGDKTKVQSARNTILYALIGLIVIFLAFATVNLITYLFNVPTITSLPQ